MAELVNGLEQIREQQAERLATGANDCQADFSSAVIQDAACPVGSSPARQIAYNDGLLIDHMAATSLDGALQTSTPSSHPQVVQAWTSDLILADHFEFASSGLAGPGGYPIINVPSGNVLGMPAGVSFIGTAFSEPTLIGPAPGFEAVSHASLSANLHPRRNQGPYLGSLPSEASQPRSTEEQTPT